MINICSFINWSTLGNIGTTVSAIAALISLIITSRQIYILKKQRIEDIRARLSFSIIVWKGLFLLKITNIGHETAYDINLCFDSEYINQHYSTRVKLAFERLQHHKIYIESQKSYYADLGCIYMRSRANCTYHASDKCDEEIFDYHTINTWLDKHFEDKINITGTYCNGKYPIKECFSLSNFIGTSIEVYDDITSELKDINKTLKTLVKK